jgi:hypothetical protein
VCSGCVLNGGKQKLGDGEPTCEHSGVRVRVVATDARSASVAGHVVRSSIILQPGGRGSASVTAATSHESLDMDANDTQGPWSCSPGSPQRVAPSQSSSQHAMQPLARVVRGGHEFDEATVHELGQTVHGSRCTADLSRSEALIVSFIISAGLPHTQATKLLKIVANPLFHPDHIRWRSWQHWTQHMQRECMHGVNMVNLSVPSLDEAGEMLFVFRSAWEIVCEMMLDTALMDIWTWHHEPQYNAAGERVFGDFMAGQSAVFGATS